ncbi:MAG: hypothetical protein MI748_14670, partial [Opitutales bacterium]|nr:hypothetical protein [Opitutales bacterium]
MDSATMINLRSVVATKSRDLEVSPALVRESLPLGVEERNRFEQFLNEERPPVREQKAQSNDEKPRSTIEREDVRKASDNEKTKEDVSGNDVSAKKADSGTRAEKESQTSNGGEGKEEKPKGQRSVAHEAVADKKSGEGFPANHVGKKVSAKAKVTKKPTTVVQEEPKLTTAKSMQWKPVEKEPAVKEKSEKAVAKDQVTDKKVVDQKSVKDTVVKSFTKGETVKTITKDAAVKTAANENAVKTIAKDEAVKTVVKGQTVKTVAQEDSQLKGQEKTITSVAKETPNLKTEGTTATPKTKEIAGETKTLDIGKEPKPTAKSVEAATTQIGTEKKSLPKTPISVQKSELIASKTETNVAQLPNKGAAKTARPAIAAQELATQGAESSQENIKSLLNSALTAADQRLAASDKEIG